MEEQLPEKQLDVSSILTFANTIGGVDRLHLLRFSILDFRFWILDWFRLQSQSLFWIKSLLKIFLLTNDIR